METQIRYIEPVGDQVRVVGEIIVILVAVMASYGLISRVLLHVLLCSSS